MKYLKQFILVAMATMALSACLGAGTAGATVLHRVTAPGNYKLGPGAELIASVSGSSISLRFTEGVLFETCTGSDFKATIDAPAGGATVTATVSSQTYSGCNHKATMLKPGKLHFAWTSGTNASVSSSGTELTIFSTLLGISCIAQTGSGTTIGTLTGAKTSGSNATIDLNGVIPMGVCGDVNLTGSYTITSPTGFNAENSAEGPEESEGPPPATELFKNTSPEPSDTLGTGTEIVASIKAGGSTVIKDTQNLTVDTCKSSELKAKTETAAGATVTAPVSELTFTGCSHKATVLKPGKIHISWIPETTNGTVKSSEAEITYESTIFGISCVYKTGAGATLGTLTGGGSGGHATIDINAVMTSTLCGDVSMTGFYSVTSPTGLVVDEG
jgi:hypothetical protein